MTNFTFKKKTVNPANLYVHSKVVELGYDHKPDAFFSKMLKKYGLYERPIIDKDGHVLTHSAEFLAAIENGVVELEVYEVDMPLMDILFLILLKNKYSVKNLMASYNTAAFFRKCIYEGSLEQLVLSDLEGDINKKIGKLMHISDSTIKRLLLVGDKAFEKLGLIQEGETSFKQVMESLKLERLRANAEAPKTPQPETQTEGKIDQNDTEVVEKKEEGYYDSKVEIVPINTVCDQEDYEEGIETELIGKTSVVSSNTGDVSFTSGEMSIAGIGILKMDMSTSVPCVILNGKVVRDVEYLAYPNRNGDKASDAFVLKQKGKDGLSIQITISNYQKAA